MPPEEAASTNADPKEPQLPKAAQAAAPVPVAMPEELLLPKDAPAPAPIPLPMPEPQPVPMPAPVPMPETIPMPKKRPLDKNVLAPPVKLTPKVIAPAIKKQRQEGLSIFEKIEEEIKEEENNEEEGRTEEEVEKEFEEKKKARAARFAIKDEKGGDDAVEKPWRPWYGQRSSSSWQEPGNGLVRVGKPKQKQEERRQSSDFLSV